jgi:hypothetical protein
MGKKIRYNLVRVGVRVTVGVDEEVAVGVADRVGVSDCVAVGVTVGEGVAVGVAVAGIQAPKYARNVAPLGSRTVNLSPVVETRPDGIVRIRLYQPGGRSANSKAPSSPVV